MLYLHPGELPKVSGQLLAQAAQLPAACELQHCMQLQQFRYSPKALVCVMHVNFAQGSHCILCLLGYHHLEDEHTANAT